MKVAVYQFEVEGSGEFPYDMLRYDMCWPATEMYDSAQLSTRKNERRKVTLRGLRSPTDGRWRSFGWTVLREREVARLDK